LRAGCDRACHNDLGNPPQFGRLIISGDHGVVAQTSGPASSVPRITTIKYQTR